MGLNIKWEAAKKENLLLKNRQLPFYSVNMSGIPLETLFFNRKDPLFHQRQEITPPMK